MENAEREAWVLLQAMGRALARMRRFGTQMSTSVKVMKNNVYDLAWLCTVQTQKCGYSLQHLHGIHSSVQRQSSYCVMHQICTLASDAQALYKTQSYPSNQAANSCTDRGLQHHYEQS